MGPDASRREIVGVRVRNHTGDAMTVNLDYLKTIGIVNNGKQRPGLRQSI